MTTERDLTDDLVTAILQGTSSDTDEGDVQRERSAVDEQAAKERVDKRIEDMRASMRSMTADELVFHRREIEVLLLHEHPLVAAQAHLYLEFLTEEEERRRGIPYANWPREPSRAQTETVRAVALLLRQGKEPTPRQVARLTGRSRTQAQALIQSCIDDGLLAVLAPPGARSR